MTEELTERSEGRNEGMNERRRSLLNSRNFANKEVSDEFQWHIGKKYADSSGGETDLARPQLDVRLALRDFARSAELPLFPGRLGPAAYVAVNLVAPVFLISLLRVRM